MTICSSRVGAYSRGGFFEGKGGGNSRIYGKCTFVSLNKIIGRNKIINFANFSYVQVVAKKTIFQFLSKY